ncbi:hypothetical protein [Leptolyngbya ohadii]|uniref:hypothetical protein n=1 Tax=Leptolyngbya ohadii TaxID=1962290 RepID=UPI000B59F39C|nr:hypothetical protein [Leptolyngbya ohadii]
MDKEKLFQQLQKQKKAVLLGLLDDAYEVMTPSQRRQIFSHLLQQIPPTAIDGNHLLQQVQQFDAASRAGEYYAPFRVNSKNFMDIPEETSAWFDRLGDLLQDSSRLTVQGDHEQAVACFQILYRLIDVMESGEEIVFADELGSWMIPGDGKQYVDAYLTSLAAIATPEQFTEQALPLIQRDSYSSFMHQVYQTACKLATPAQKKQLQAEAKRQNIRTQPKS